MRNINIENIIIGVKIIVIVIAASISIKYISLLLRGSIRIIVILEKLWNKFFICTILVSFVRRTCF